MPGNPGAIRCEAERRRRPRAPRPARAPGPTRARPRRSRKLAALQVLDHMPFGERRRAECGVGREWQDSSIVDCRGSAVPGERSDVSRSAGRVQKLRRRIDLERAQREKETDGLLCWAVIPYAVPAEKRGLSGFSGRERGRLERQPGATPRHGGNRQVALRERVCGPDVAPRQEGAVGEQERLDRERAFSDFERAVLRQEPFFRIAVHSDHGPVDLLARERPRIGAARSVFRDRLEERVRRRGESERLYEDLAYRVSLSRGPLFHADPKVTGFRFGQVHVVLPAVAAGDAPGFPPVLPVAGELDRILPGEELLVPEDHEAAVLPLLQEIDEEPLVADAFDALPGRLEIAVEGSLRIVPRRRRDRRDLGGPRVGLRRRKLRERQLVHPHRALPSGPRRHRELDRGDFSELAPASRTPRELDVTLLDRHLSPVARKLEVAAVQPPDVLAALVDELELEVVHRRVGAKPERELPVLGHLERNRPPRGGPTGAALEVEVHSERPATEPGVGRERERDSVRRRRLPAGDVLEVVEDHRIAGRARAGKDEAETDQEREDSGG